MEVARWRNG